MITLIIHTTTHLLPLEKSEVVTGSYIYMGHQYCTTTVTKTQGGDSVREVSDGNEFTVMEKVHDTSLVLDVVPHHNVILEHYVEDSQVQHTAVRSSISDFRVSPNTLKCKLHGKIQKVGKQLFTCRKKQNLKNRRPDDRKVRFPV